MSPELSGRFLTTVPPGKPPVILSLLNDIVVGHSLPGKQLCAQSQSGLIDAFYTICIKFYGMIERRMNISPHGSWGRHGKR